MVKHVRKSYAMVINDWCFNLELSLHIEKYSGDFFAYDLIHMVSQGSLLITKSECWKNKYNL